MDSLINYETVKLFSNEVCVKTIGLGWPAWMSVIDSHPGTTRLRLLVTGLVMEGPSLATLDSHRVFACMCVCMCVCMCACLCVFVPYIAVCVIDLSYCDRSVQASPR